MAQVPTRYQQGPPVSTSLRASSTTLALDGQPPLIMTTTYVCITTKPIWALVGLFTHVGNGIVIRDPSRLVGGRPRRIGPSSTIYEDDWDEDALDLEETQLIRLDPGEKFETTYTIGVTPKLDGLRGSDTYAMKKGNTYYVSLRKRRWRWMFQEELGEGVEREKWKETLSNVKPMEWDVECVVHLKAD